MTPMEITYAVLFAGFALSYGWGMRGTIIGGEKGALLPGALLGLSISVFVGNGSLLPYFPYLVATGALSMFYGGIEPYAQTMDHIMSRDRKGTFYEGKQNKGALGIFMKGGLWYGIASGMLAMLFLGLSGELQKWESVLMMLLIPVVSYIGTLIWNKPFCPEKKEYPKIYFSNGSREEWGGNVLLLLVLCVFAVLHKSAFVLGAVACGVVCGGLGFLFGLLIYDYSVRKHNGKYLFGSLQEKRYIDGWKIMEHFFGAFAGGGVMLYFCLCSDYITEASDKFTASGLLHNGDIYDNVASVAVFIFLLLTALQYPIAAVYEKKHGKSPEINIFERIERPLFSAIPLVFVFTGAEKASMAVALLTIGYALCEKCGLEWFRKFKSKDIMSTFYLLFFIGITVTFFTVKNDFALRVVVLLLYTFGYTVSVWMYALMPDRFREKKQQGKKFGEYFKSGITVYGHFMIQSIVIACLLINRM